MSVHCDAHVRRAVAEVCVPSAVDVDGKRVGWLVWCLGLHGGICDRTYGESAVVYKCWTPKGSNAVA